MCVYITFLSILYFYLLSLVVLALSSYVFFLCKYIESNEKRNKFLVCALTLGQ